MVAYESGRKDRPILANPNSGIREIFACGIRNPQKKIACVMRNPGLWNTEYSSRNPESHLTIGVQNPSSTEKESITWNAESTAWNPALKTVLGYHTVYMGRQKGRRL